MRSPGGHRSRRGLAYVEVLVIVAVVVTLGLLAVHFVGRASNQQAIKEAACIQSFACGRAATAGASRAPELGTTQGSEAPRGGAASGKSDWVSKLGAIARNTFVGVQIDLGKVRLDGWASPSGLGAKVRNVPFEVVSVSALGGKAALAVDAGMTPGGFQANGGVVGTLGPGSVSYMARYDQATGKVRGVAAAALAREAPVVGFKFLGVGARVVVGVLH